MSTRIDGPELLTTGEVGRLFGVDNSTVIRWHAEGKISCLRTPARHRRFHRTETEALLQGEPLTPAQVEAMWAAYRNGASHA